MRYKPKRFSRANIIEAIAIIIFGLSSVLFLLWILNLSIIQPVFQELKERRGVEDNKRVLSSITNELSNLTNITTDWGNWDDTYKFAENHNQEYIESNAPTPALLSDVSKIDLFILYDKNGLELFRSIYHPDLSREVILDVTSGLASSLSSIMSSVLSTEIPKQGLLVTNEGLLILVARPILNTLGQRPSHGVIIMGRFLSQSILSSIAERVALTFELFSKGDERLTAFEKMAFDEISSDFKPKFYYDFIYQIYTDIDNQPALLVRTPLRHDITLIGRKTGKILSVTLGSISLCLLICLAGYRLRMKASQEQLKESEARYKSIFQNEYSVMLLVNPENGAILDANAAACAYYGWTHDEMVQMKIDAINVMTADEINAEIELARSEKRQYFLFKHRRADGVIRDVEVYSQPITLEGKSFLFSIVHDITARIKMEEERSEVEARSQQSIKTESLSRMAGAIAHLFNNHLAVVLGNIEMALVDLTQDAVPRKNLVTAQDAALKAAEISAMMLTYLGKNINNFTSFSLSDVCCQYLPTLRAMIPNSIILKTNFMAPSPIIRGNIKQLQRILSILVTNSWEAIGDKVGEITLRTFTLNADDIPNNHITPSDIDSDTATFACLEISDNGCGMTEDCLDLIFDPFFTTKFTGRGLGIPIILGIVNACKGRIWVKSAINEGTIFRLFFPLSNDIAPPQSEKEAIHIGTGNSKTVLVIDDQETVRKMAKGMLERLGFKVLTAPDGSSAICLYQQHQNEIDMVMTDLSMLGMNGWEILTALRKIKPAIRVILTSGYGEGEVMAAKYEERPQVFLQKPYNMEELKKAVDNALS